ncbi:Lactose operon repressor [Microbacterium hydrocarbonoxydans]|uniref:Lactose operon repressor n=1 Tax=Microbacterium hydrocarbonoxydans TaxID=273678 RepID=A0A0M2HS20_9MICO|nr:LacI family DNA-binding transcriptional regulator [Microbacterium hydrocarbonoxydans]KJL47268.1 Lactose operon repressor [Microbacterium hydrocarbonoxydans]
MQKRTTSRDVARLAGVSQATVSYVFTGKDTISAPTRDRVLRAAAELNYQPNLAARSMRTSRTGRLAVVMTVSSLNPRELLLGATEAASEAGYVIEVVYLPGGPDERAARLAQLVSSSQYEGILSFSPIPVSPASADAEPGATVVLSLSEFDDDMHVTGEFTDARPIAEMMERLVQLGHRRFVHITGALDFPSAISRRDEYLAAVERLGVESLGVIEGDWSAETGYRIAQALPDTAPPFALIAANDLVATGAMRAAIQRGWHIPSDMSVTGWDDAGQSAYLVPSLTTVVQDRQTLGANAARRLIAAVRREPVPAPATGLQHIVWRESTAAPSS